MSLILPGRMRQQPQEGATLERGHPLLLGVTEVALPHVRRTFVQGFATSLSFAGTGTLALGARVAGSAAVFGTGTAAGLLVGNSLKLFPGNECTVFIVRRSLDTTGRGIRTFGFNQSVTDRVLIAAPLNDGNCYWDYDNTTTGAGGGRISVAFTKQIARPEMLVFVAGAAKGREIWRDGIKIAGNTAVNAALSISSQTVAIGSADGAGSCDNEEVYLAGVVARAWSDAEVREWTANPWQIFRSPARRYYLPGAAASVTARPQVFIAT
jgi:hypothetical protein